MPKIKSPTPQEIYRAKKEREEQEKVAFLPPGLVNHGNTCFMNSVLQGLLATQLLSDLVHFNPIPEQAQKNSSTLLASRRSPLLTNGHGLAGPYEQPWVNSMPLGDVFLSIMLRAWESQSLRKRESLSPKPLLGILGKKYDQYLDFAQQDAHEFMRILLDSIRMEEFDVIKKRQPPPPSDSQRKKRRRTTITPSSFASSDVNTGSSSAEPIPEEEKLISFADMVFGGKLTSILVCQKCKHISQTYEDFNDLSLSMKAEDYVRERKRDRLKTLAKKLKALNPSSPSANTLTASHSQRASSVPPSPRPREIDDVELGAAGHPPSVDEPRRRSFDVADQEKDGFQAVNGHISGVSTPGEEKHIEFLDPNQKQPKEKDRTSKDWAKLGRRISMTVGLKKAVKEGKERKGRGRERESRDLSNGIGGPSGSTSTPRASLSDVKRASQPTSKSSSLERLAPPESRSKRPISLQLPPRVSSSAVPTHAIFTNITRPKPPKTPKTSSAESAYLRRILADVPPSSSHSPFAMFAQGLAYSGVNGVAAAASASSSQPLWLKPVGKVPSIEECLRLFTAVEVLDNENMVGCRRCWKIENGVYGSAENEDDEDDDDESVDQDPEEDDDDDEKLLRPNSLSAPSTAAERPILPTSLSTPSISIYSHPSTMSGTASVSSLPTLATSISDSAVESKPTLPSLTVSTTRIPLESQLEDAMSSNPGGLPIPSISTAPPSPEEDNDPSLQPLTARPEGAFPPNYDFGRDADTPLSDTQASHVRTSSNNSLQPPSRRTRDPDSTDESSEEESDVSLSTSVNSLDSAGSYQESANSTGSGNVTSQSATPSKPKAKSKSKPVIMRPAYKRYLIATPPPVLVIHLKRFQQISKSILSFSSGFKKLDDYVTFPEYLDLTPFLAPRREDFGLDKGGSIVKPRSKDGQQCMYRLYAVVVHIGSMLGGHYISYTALPQPPPESSPDKAAVGTPPVSASKPQRPERQWAYISDIVVRLTSIDEVLKAKAYLCLYERI